MQVFQKKEVASGAIQPYGFSDAEAPNPAPQPDLRPVTASPEDRPRLSWRRRDERAFRAAVNETVQGLSPERYAAVMQRHQFSGATSALGVHLDHLARAHLEFLEGSAAKEGKSVGEFLRGETDRRGYGGATPTWWPSLSPAQQRRWQRTFEQVVARVKSGAPPDIRYQIEEAEKAGGGIRFLPAQVERLNAYAFRQGNVLGVGRDWVEDGQRDPELVYANIAHELGGHLEYGATVSWEIMKRTLEMLPPEERAIASSGGNSLQSSYGYMETELYAELREMAHRVPGSGGDEPEKDIVRQLGRIAEAFPWPVAWSVMQGLLHRVRNDPRVTSEAAQALASAVAEIERARSRPQPRVA